MQIKTKIEGLKIPNILYDDNEHSYTHLDTGKLYAGVSSVAELLPKPYLVQWAASECANAVREKWTPDKAFNKDEIEAVLKDAKVMHRKKSKEAADIGTGIHDIISNHITAILEGKDASFPLLTDEVQKRAITEFEKFERENKVEWLASELLVCNEDTEVAGRLDALAIVNEKKTIIDFKVSKSISDSYYLQTGGYWDCLVWMGWTPEDRLIIRIPKTAELKVWDNKAKRYNTVENVLEVCRVPTDINFDIETFRHMRQTYKWINQNILRR